MNISDDPIQSHPTISHSHGQISQKTNLQKTFCSIYGNLPRKKNDRFRKLIFLHTLLILNLNEILGPQKFAKHYFWKKLIHIKLFYLSKKSMFLWRVFLTRYLLKNSLTLVLCPWLYSWLHWFCLTAQLDVHSSHCLIECPHLLAHSSAVHTSFLHSVSSLSPVSLEKRLHSLEIC